MQEQVIKAFYENKNPEKAVKMASYMKDNFPFLGIQKPLRAELQKEFIKDTKKSGIIDWEFVLTLWKLPEREFQYLAVDYITALKGALQASDIEKIEGIITQKSWWDSVDAIASNIVGYLCLKHPELVESHILRWAQSENIWLARAAILFQLKYKDKTDTVLLCSIIGMNSSSNEFFITKAIGWALREYSKTNAQWVREFVENNRLQPLSIREASKYI